MKVWIDIKNSHEPLFFKSLMADMPQHDYYITCRDYAEIVKLLNRYKIPHQTIGGRPQGSMPKRMLGFAGRLLKLYRMVPKFDFALSHASLWSVYLATMRFKKDITITDNDIDHPLNRRMFRYVDTLITPDAISVDHLVKENAKRENIIQFHGYKEDIYIADYRPDPNFLDHFPFKDFVTLRPEPSQATYVPRDVPTIIPDVIKTLSKANLNILYLPRYESDYAYAKGYPNIYIPKEPLNGLDICFHSKAVLTGSGTFAREAACLGIPSVSFFGGLELLAVDQKMIFDSWVYHSRKPEEIVEYVLTKKRRPFTQARSKKVKQEIIHIINNILDGDAK